MKYFVLKHVKKIFPHPGTLKMTSVESARRLKSTVKRTIKKKKLPLTKDQISTPKKYAEILGTMKLKTDKTEKGKH